MKTKTLALVLAAAASGAQAQTFLITQGRTYYRYTAGTTQSYTLGNDITGLTTVPAGVTAGNQNGGAAPGEIFAVSNGDGGNIAYRLNNPLATPSLTQVGVMGGGGNNSPCFANGKLYGVLLGVDFLEYDTTTLAWNNTWSTGVFGGSGGLVHSGGNSFLFVEGLNDALYGYTIGGAAAQVGALGIDIENSALEAYGGVIYAALGRVDTGQLVLGTVSATTGQFTQIDVIDTYRGQSVGLAVVPAPGVGALLPLAGLLAARRRRRGAVAGRGAGGTPAPGTALAGAALLLCASGAAAQTQNVFFGSAGFGGSQNALYTTDLNGGGLQDILPGSMVVSGVAADGASRMVFWQQPHHGQGQQQWAIHAADFSGGSHSVIATWTQPVANNYGVAVDRANKRVFWTDLNGINSANYDGTGAGPVLASFNPLDLEVDPAANRMFWITENGSSASIWSATLSGANPTAIATVPTRFVQGIALNPGTQTVYWSDYLSGTVSALPYAGGSPTTILSGYQFVQGLEYEATTNRLYMINKGGASVAWMNPAGGPVTTVFVGSGPTRGEMHDVAVVVPAPGAAVLLPLACLLAARRRRGG